MEGRDHAGEPLWERCWGWLAGVPGWACLLVSALVWCGLFALSWLARTLLVLFLPASVGMPLWWGISLALTAGATMLVVRPRSLGDRLAGPVLYAVAFGLPGAGCYLAVRAAGQLNPSPLCRRAAAIAEWLPDRARELFSRRGPQPAEPQPGTPSRRVCGFILLACLIVTFLLYRPILGAGIKATIAHEDLDYLLTVKRHGPWRWSEYLSPWYFKRGLYTDAEWTWYRPVQLLTYAVDYAVWGERVQGWHLTGVLLHLANVALLFTAVNLVARSRTAGLAAAGLYAVLPDHVAAVGWISGRMDPLCVLFALGALICLSLVLAGSSKCLWPAVGALFLLALGCKELTVLIAGLLAVWIVLAESGLSWRLRVAAALTLCLVTLGYVVWRHVIGTIHEPPRQVYPGWQGTRSLRWYAAALWAPSTQIASALQTRSLGFRGANLVALVAALGLLRRQWRAGGFWLLWKAVLLVPTVGFAAMAAWREYAPNLGTCAISGILVGQGMATTSKWPVPLRWTAVAVVLWFAVQYARALPQAVNVWLK